MGARSVGFVLDPVQSVPGHVVMDCFRTIDSMDVAMANESRTTQSNTYYTKAKPSKEAQMRGVNKIYYNMCVDAKTDDPNEIEMLHKIRLTKWQQTFLVDARESERSVQSLKQLRDLSKLYKSQISVTESEDSELGKLRLVGKIDARAELKHLNEILI